MLKNEVKFIEMKDGDKEDYELLANFEDKFVEGTADRLVRVLKGLDKSLGGYKVSRLEHSLQTASRALRDNACLLYTSPSPRDMRRSRMPSSA